MPLVIRKKDMNQPNYTATFAVNETPKQVYDAINNVRAWWSGNIDGRTDKLGEVFTYRYEDVHYSKQKITEMVPGKKVVWHVLDGRLNFVKDKTEWTGTDIVFEISKNGKNETELRFTHVGLVPAFECYDACTDAWGSYIRGSLKDLITKGKGFPNPSEEKLTTKKKITRSKNGRKK
jgi:hypothetical protein